MSQDPVEPQTRRFTYSEAKALLPEVRRVTAEVQARVEELQAALGERPGAAGEARARIEHEVDAWARRLTGLGLGVKGLWLVDFDNGAGYYCWRWPEADLEYFHSYEEGFSGRVRIH